jgi:quercetin dioxygenase-like cupin family protein
MKAERVIRGGLPRITTPTFEASISQHLEGRNIAMSLNLTEITGAEARAGDGSPLDALIDFYRSFNAKDVAGLATNWAEGDAPSMDNPIGGIRRGWPAIREGYSKLFNGPATVQVAFHDFSSQGGNDWHLFVGREKGVCTTPTASLDLRIRTTRWFIEKNGVWRQLHHHGSIEEPTLLADYQRAIFGAPLKEEDHTVMQKEHTDLQAQIRTRPPGSGVATIVTTEKLPNVPGKSLTVQITDLPPSGRIPEHHHGGANIDYVLSGAVRMQLAGGSVLDYLPGQTLFEPPGSVHLSTENLSLTEPAKIMLIHIADDGVSNLGQLTIFH